MSSPRGPGAWIALILGLFVMSVTAAAMLGWPPSLRPGLGSNLALASSLLALAAWWAVALPSAPGTRARIAAGLAVLAAAAGSLGGWSLALASTGWVPASMVLFLTLELPAWGGALLAWPGPPRQPDAPRAHLALDVLIVLASASVIGWDFLIRPSGGFPAPTFARLSIASWLIVFLGLGAGAIRGSRSDVRVPFRLLLLSVGISFAGSYVVVAVPTWPPQIILVASTLALLLRLASAEALRAEWGGGAQDGGMRRGAGALWIAVATLALLGVHEVAAPDAGRAVRFGGGLVVVALLGLRSILRPRGWNA